MGYVQLESLGFCFSLKLENFSHCFFKYIFRPTVFLLSFWDCEVTNIRSPVAVPGFPESPFLSWSVSFSSQSVSFLSFRLNKPLICPHCHYICPVSSLLCHWTHPGSFYWNYSIFQLHIFYLVHFYNFYYCAKVLLFFFLHFFQENLWLLIEVSRWKGSLCWARLKEKGEGGGRGWDGWMASLTQWTWIGVNFGR